MRALGIVGITALLMTACATPVSGEDLRPEQMIDQYPGHSGVIIDKFEAGGRWIIVSCHKGNKIYASDPNATFNFQVVENSEDCVGK